ncbi:helix-turn-helix domain-containing protein [Streptomyces sp. MH13]|uniref:helix-turn-helix domain-containing protein n=1 Tax=Streptomyces sp. MH13 TaxID=3417651 RepID=UPI003CEF426E
MGRRENAVAADTRQAAALARWLRAQRERSGLTYAAMAKLTDHEFTASAFSRGASGRVVPTRRLLLAFTSACGADPDEALRMWTAARRAREDRRRRAGISPEFQDLATGGGTTPDGRTSDRALSATARSSRPAGTSSPSAPTPTASRRSRSPSAANRTCAHIQPAVTGYGRHSPGGAPWPARHGCTLSTASGACGIWPGPIASCH